MLLICPFDCPFLLFSLCSTAEGVSSTDLTCLMFGITGRGVRLSYSSLAFSNDNYFSIAILGSPSHCHQSHSRRRQRFSPLKPGSPTKMILSAYNFLIQDLKYLFSNTCNLLYISMKSKSDSES